MLVCSKRYKLILYYKKIQNFLFLSKKIVIASDSAISRLETNQSAIKKFIKEIKFLKLNFLNMLYLNDKKLNNNMAFAICPFTSLCK